MMVFKVPKELAEQPILACANCHNPVPNDMLDHARHGTLGPCPRCGSEKLADNPFAALTYAVTLECEGRELAGSQPIFEFTRFAFHTSQVNTEKKVQRNPLIELLELALST